MEVYDVHERKVLAVARGDAWCESGWLVFHLALTGFLVWVAVTGVAGVPALVWWLLAGAVGNDALTSVRNVPGAVRELRALSTCGSCLAAAVELAEAEARRLRCGWAGHGHGSVDR